MTQYYGGDQAKFQADVDRYGLTAADLNYEFQTSVLETKITDKLTDQVAVTDQDVQDYYDQNKASYKSTSDSRVVDYALFPDKASAEAAQKKLAGGAGFSDVAAGTDRHQREPRALHCRRRARSTRRSSSRRSRCRRTSSRRSSRSTRPMRPRTSAASASPTATSSSGRRADVVRPAPSSRSTRSRPRFARSCSLRRSSRT